MYSALYSVCLKSKVNISVTTSMDIVLVKSIIQALIQVIQVQKNYSSTSLHANLDLVYISTHLNNVNIALEIIMVCL